MIDPTRKVAGLALCMVAALQLTACGYLIFPERTGQPVNRLDWGVVGLDAVGLLFGIVPGVVAFAIDFATGCIYLPPSPYLALAPADAPVAPAALPADPDVLRNWRPALVLGPFPTLAEATAAVLQHTGHDRPGAMDQVVWRTQPPTVARAPAASAAAPGGRG